MCNIVMPSKIPINRCIGDDNAVFEFVRNQLIVLIRLQLFVEK